jgi:hypothetical protein
MKTKGLLMVLLVAVGIATVSFAQEKICIDGKCQAAPAVGGTIVLDPLREELTLVDQTPRVAADGVDGDRFDQVIRATVRITVSGVCGSGTVVGRTSEGNAIVLTNAHVAGTTRGRTVNVERWNTNGSSEKGSSLPGMGEVPALTSLYSSAIHSSPRMSSRFPWPIAIRAINRQ